MRPDTSGINRQDFTYGHNLTLRLGVIQRDGVTVKITRVSQTEVKVGCTTVEIAALRRLLEMVVDNPVLQDGAE